MCLSGGAVTALAPVGQAAAGRAAPRPTVAIATTPDLGAAPTPIPPTSGQVPPQNPVNLPTTAGRHEAQVRFFFKFFLKPCDRITFSGFLTLLYVTPSMCKFSQRR